MGSESISNLSEHRYKNETSSSAAADNSRRMTKPGRLYREMVEKIKIKRAHTSEKKKWKEEKGSVQIHNQ